MAAASLDLSFLAPEKAVQVLFSGTAPRLRDTSPKMLSNAADSQKAISYSLLGLFQGTPAWQRLASLHPPPLTKSKRWPRRLLSPRGGGGVLQQSGGTCGGAGVPVARGGCKLERLQVPVLPKFSNFCYAEKCKKKKKDGAHRDALVGDGGRGGEVAGRCACPRPGPRAILGYPVRRSEVGKGI